jgi:hypothetical protein
MQIRPNYPEVFWESDAPRPKSPVENAFVLKVDWADIAPEVIDSHVGWVRVLKHHRGPKFTMELDNHTDVLRYRVLYG